MHSILPLFAALLLSVAGCSSSSDPAPEPEAKELRAESDPLATEVPEAELTHLSKRLYQVGMYTVARDSLASLKDRYPMGAYASFAELKHADTFFFNHENDLAAKMYEDFIKNHPGSAEAPYAKLQAARSHVASARTAGRDRVPWERALTIYDEIIASYAGTSYADVAAQERIPVIRELSSYDREIIEFYRRAGNSAAVQERESRFNERWAARLVLVESAGKSQTTSSFKSLRELSTISFQAEPNAGQSTEQPSSDLVNRELQPTEERPITQGGQAITPTAPLEQGRIAVQSVSCSTEGAPFATIEVLRIPDRLAPTEHTPEILSPVDGRVTLPGLALAARQPTFDCFGEKDLEITDQGDLRLLSESHITVTALQNPPRILLSPAL